MKTFFRICLTCAVGTSLIRLVDGSPLKEDDVIASVKDRYPPLLAAWIEQDLANGRVRQAQGAFDPLLQSTLSFQPLNYYDGTRGEMMLEKPMSDWGGSVYGGYRISSGFLPSYKREYRTADGGEAVLGFRIPLLRGGSIDKRRANLQKAELDRELADPFILKQYLDILRGARISYFNWLAAGKKLQAAREVLRIAEQRKDSLDEMISRGAMAEIIGVDNERLVVKRRIEVIKAERGFEAATIALSLFYREAETGVPVVAGEESLPDGFPEATEGDQLMLINDRGRALFHRPETRQIELYLAKVKLEQRLAENDLKPNLDLGVELNQALGADRPEDISDTELTGLLKFSIPIGRNEAKGRVETAKAQISQLKEDKQFARERIIADANDSHSAAKVAHAALAQTKLSVSLSEKMEAAENEKFSGGASDLLALQIREEATFEAKLSEIDANLAYFTALANYQAATAKDTPAGLMRRY